MDGGNWTHSLAGGGGSSGGNHSVSSTAEAPAVSLHYTRAATVAAAVCCIVFVVVGVIGNVVTLLVLRRSLKMPGRLSTAATVFLLSLCVSDLLFCAINLPLTAARYIHEAWLLGDTACRLFPFFMYGNVAASLFSMAAIAINRYILICHKRLHGKIYRLRYIGVMVACIWIASFCPMLLPLAGVWGRLGLDGSTFSCTILSKDGASPKKALFVIGVLVPCIIISVCYLLIYVRATRQRITTGRSSMPNSYSVQSINRKHSARTEENRLTTMMVTVFLAFIICFVPLMLVNVFDGDEVRLPTLHVVASVLAWLSAVINPFIYAGSSRYYRAIYRELVCGRDGGATSRNDGDDDWRTDGGATTPQWDAVQGRLAYNDAD